MKFVEITNKQIYDKICEIETHVKITNGKVKLNRWMCTTAMALIVVLIGAMAL